MFLLRWMIFGPFDRWCSNAIFLCLFNYRSLLFGFDLFAVCRNFATCEINLGFLWFVGTLFLFRFCFISVPFPFQFRKLLKLNGHTHPIALNDRWLKTEHKIFCCHLRAVPEWFFLVLFLIWAFARVFLPYWLAVIVVNYLWPVPVISECGPYLLNLALSLL